MPKIGKASVFGSSSASLDSYEGQTALTLARTFSERGITIVHGGFAGGIMDFIGIALEPLEQSKALGIIRSKTSRCSPYLKDDQKVFCDDMDPATYPRTMGRRLGILADSDAFVIILGPTSGSGTATELCAVVDYNINKHGPDGCYRPVVILHPQNTYENVEFQLIGAFGQKGLEERRRDFKAWMASNGHDSWLKIVAPSGNASSDAQEAVKFILGD